METNNDQNEEKDLTWEKLKSIGSKMIFTPIGTPLSASPVEGEKEERVEGLNAAADRYVSMHEDSAVTSMYGHHYRTFLAGANWQEKRTASRIKALEREAKDDNYVISILTEQVKALEERLGAAESVIDNLGFEPTLNGTSVFKPRKGYKAWNEALEAYNKLKH